MFSALALKYPNVLRQVPQNLKCTDAAAFGATLSDRVMTLLTHFRRIHGTAGQKKRAECLSSMTPAAQEQLTDLLSKLTKPSVSSGESTSATPPASVEAKASKTPVGTSTASVAAPGSKTPVGTSSSSKRKGRQ